MMVGMPRELEQQRATHHMIAVPGMMLVHALITSVFVAIALQSVMFDVIDHFQQAERQKRCEDVDRQECHPENERQSDQPQGLDEGEAEHVVADVPGADRELRQATRFQLPGRNELSADTRKQESVHALPFPGGGGIFVCGDGGMVSAHMLDREMHVQDRHQDALADPLFQLRTAMHQLMRHRDADTACAQRDGQNPSRLHHPRRIGLCDAEAESEHQRDGNRQIGEQDPGVEPARFGAGLGLRIQVPVVAPDPGIQGRHHHEHDDGREPREGSAEDESGRGGKRDGKGPEVGHGEER